MAVLLLAEVNGAELAVDATAKAVSASKALGDVTVLCASAGCGGAAEAAAKLMALQKYCAQTMQHMATGLAEPVSDLVGFACWRL